MKNHNEKIERYLKGVVLPEYESHLHRQQLRREVLKEIERRQTMLIRKRAWKVAAVLAILIGVGAISVVGVNIGKIYYWGKTDDGSHHIFYSEGGEGALGNGFITTDANGVTDVEQKRRDLEEMKILSQQGKKELLRVEEAMINGTVDMRVHEYKYVLSDGRTNDMREGMKWGGGFDDEKRWQEWRRLKEAGPGQDLGTYEETVENRVFSFKRERYVLSDGTEIIWSVGLPKDSQ
ncbi:MAG: hypothetical protein A2168_00685 [Planctomycetes bacterium RBG_13_50_24]|nr:MAG: hypothetical protein A2168_00685 [Planctomycetes bacterium RBG_13_50_24]